MFFLMYQPTVLADSALIHFNYFARYGLTKMGAATAPDGTGAAEKLLNRSFTPVGGLGNEKPHGRPSRESRAAFIVKLFFVIFPEAVAFAGKDYVFLLICRAYTQG